MIKKMLNWASARVLAAIAFSLPLAAMAATSTYSTDGTVASASAYTPDAGNGNAVWQAFHLRNAVTTGSGEHFLFLKSGDTDIAETQDIVKLEAIKVIYGANGHTLATFGHANKNGGTADAEQQTPYLVITTPQNVVLGVSGVADSPWAASGTNTFNFSNVILASNARYRFHFATADEVSAVTVGSVFTGASSARCNMKYHYSSSNSRADEDVASGADATYSVNAQIVVSEVSEGDALVLEPTAEGVTLQSGDKPVVVNGTPGGVVNVAAGAVVPSVTVKTATVFNMAGNLTTPDFQVLAASTISNETDVVLSTRMMGSSAITKGGAGALTFDKTGQASSLVSFTEGKIVYSGNESKIGSSAYFNMKGSDCSLEIAPGAGNTITLTPDYLVNSTENYNPDVKFGPGNVVYTRSADNVNQYGCFARTHLNILNGGKLTLGSRQMLGWTMIQNINIASGGELVFANMETLTRNLNLNGGKLTLTADNTAQRSLDIFKVADGGTVNVTADSTIDSATEDAVIWLRDGNNNQTFPFDVAANATLTINAVVADGTNTSTMAGKAVSKTGAGTLRLTKANTATGALSVNAGTLELDGGSWAGTVNVAANGTLDVIKTGAVAAGEKLVSGTFTLATGASVMQNGAPVDAVVQGDGIYVAAATVSDGMRYVRVSDALTYVYMHLPTNLVVTVADTTWTDDGSYDEWFTWDFNAKTYTPKAMVARVGTVCYSSFASAVANATAGQTVVLLDNVALSSTVVITNSITLDLNGKNIAATDARALWIKSGAVSITGTGEISANGTGLGETSSVIRVGDGAVNANAAGLTIGAGVRVSSAKCYGVTVFGKNTPGITLVVNGTVAVTSSGEADAAISGNGSPGLAATYITINNGATVTSAHSAAIYNPGAGTLTVNGGTISGKHGIVARAGSVTVNGGTITATGTAQDAETIGDAGNAVPCAAIVYDAGANYPGFDEGTALEIKGGTITANVDSIETTGEPSVAVSGGTFSSAVDSEYCAEGFEPTSTTVGGVTTYGVRVDRGWIYEAYDYPGYTGSWAKDVTYDGTTHKAAIEDGNTYTATNPSDGRMVTLNMTMSFDGANDDDTDLSLAKAAVRLGEGANSGEYVFELATTGTVDNVATQVWATATGFTPMVETDYNLLFVLDLTNKTYTAAVITYANETATTNALSVAGSTTIAFANQGAATAVQEIEFVGGGSVTALTGSYEDVEEPEVFVANDEVTLSGGSATLTAAQAAWLNACGAKAAVAAKIATLDAAAFNDAYLLNLDVMGDFSYEFAVTDIEVGGAAVTVTVSLTRTGALTENEAAKPINGKLTLSGTAALGTAFAEISSEALEFENAGFSGGATNSTVTVDTTETTARFYKAVITTPAED